MVTIIASIGKYNLPYIWYGVVFNTPELEVKNKQEPQELQGYNITPVTSMTGSTVGENICLQT